MDYMMKAKDGLEIYVRRWDNVEEPKGVVLIYHGMAEHGGRYQDFAKHLNANGYIAYADDHRGHGKTANSIENLGYIGEDGFNRIIEDEYDLMNDIKKKHPNLPVVVLGHSFGSLLAQDFITRYGNDISGVILSGSTKKEGMLISAGIVITSICSKLFGKRKKLKLLDTITFFNYNKGIDNPKSKFAWLSRDENIVREYEEDPYCGTLFPIAFFYYLSRALGPLYDHSKLAAIPKDLPIFIISGSQDPFGEYGKGPTKLYKMYKALNIKDVELKLYEGGRHEMINEINKEQVYEDIIHWLDRIIAD
ncbi:alpha/beta hydrolase [Lutispora thermophila]|uniref:Lysophospholipase, alpha-beta hydrolase superfamily n=1 Tax=Lutispora thermophila DSM 19022 TaxID=1122184 RepID=A0A1M6E4Z6_9FIRM|nr:alpha/beta hydrolase [Lutispora thermophila]SHI80567.1 Lysophospholipase, alpha-beta hydrolase superfamily [Lutispora thermophila DSM 19022]